MFAVKSPQLFPKYTNFNPVSHLHAFPTFYCIYCIFPSADFTRQYNKILTLILFVPSFMVHSLHNQTSGHSLTVAKSDFSKKKKKLQFFASWCLSAYAECLRSLPLELEIYISRLENESRNFENAVSSGSYHQNYL